MWVVVVSTLCVICGPCFHLRVSVFKYLWDGEMHTHTFAKIDRKIEREKKRHINRNKECWNNKKNERGEKGEAEKAMGCEEGEKL
jgi:hypothetical protein